MTTLIAKFLEHLEVERNYSRHTIAAYRRDLNQFSAFLESQPDGDVLQNPSEIGKAAIRNFLGYLHTEQYSKRTIARRFAAVRSWFHYLCREGLVKANPALYLTSPKLDQRLPKFLDQAQVEELVELPDRTNLSGVRDSAIIELLYGTGMRVSEMVALEVRSVDFSGERVRVIGKGDKERLVPLGGHALVAVESYLEHRNARWESQHKKARQETALFLNHRGRRITSRGVQTILAKYGLQMGHDKLTPHTLRHTAATHLLDAGADLIAVKEILGHERLSTTQVYTHVALDRLRRTYEKAHPKA